MLRLHAKPALQGQVPVPAAVRHLLGLTPGSMVEGKQEGDSITVRRAARSSTLDIHGVLFPEGGADATAKSLTDLKQGIRERMKHRHARR